MLSLFCGAALAFSPPVSHRVQTGLSRHSALTVAPATCNRCRVSAEPSMALGGVVKWALAAPVMYTLMSINEYATHRWYQHEEFNRDHSFQRFCQRVAHFLRKRPLLLKDGRRNMIKIKGGGHVEHHAETYDDMSLKKDERWRRTPAAASLDADKFRGTALKHGQQAPDYQRPVRAIHRVGSPAAFRGLPSDLETRTPTAWVPTRG